MTGSLTRTVWLLGAISFLNEATSELIYPLLPLYLAATMAFDPRVLGLIEGVSLTATGLTKLLSGVLADKTRAAKPWVVGGYLMAGIARPLYVFAHSWPLLFLLRLTERVGKGLRGAPRDALLAQSIPLDRLGLAFGVHRAFDHAGAVAGPLLAALLLTLDVPLRQIFFWTAAPAFLVVLLSLTVRDPAPPKTTHPFRWNLAEFDPAFRRFLAVQALFMLGYPSNLFILIRAEELGIPNAELPLLWSLVALGSACFSAFFSGLSDRVGRQRLILAGWLIHALFFWCMGINHDQAWLLWLLFPSLGLYLAATEGPQRALVAELAHFSQLGSAYGWFNMTSWLMLLPGSFLFGELWKEFGSQTAFSFSALCSLSAALLQIRWVGQTRSPREPNTASHSRPAA